jgi:hypothetical protein
MNVRQGITETITVAEICLGEFAMLACVIVKEIRTIRASAKIDLVSFQVHSRFSVSVAHDNSARDGSEGLLYQMSRKLDQISIGDKGTGPLQQI